MKTAVLSLFFLLTSFPPSHLFHINHSILSPFPPLYSVIHTSLVIVVSQVTLYLSRAPPASIPFFLTSFRHYFISHFSLHSCFPLSFFSLTNNDTGKFTPVTLRMELLESCGWMLHGALDWCMRCNTGGFVVHGEHCGRCKAGLVLTKSNTF